MARRFKMPIHTPQYSDLARPFQWPLKNYLYAKDEKGGRTDGSRFEYSEYTGVVYREYTGNFGKLEWASVLHTQRLYYYIVTLNTGPNFQSYKIVLPKVRYSVAKVRV